MKAPEITIYVKTTLKKKLADYRPKTFGFSFGTIENICKQYGIKYTVLKTCMSFTAPKTRIQLFVEKLHFARISYSSNPL